MNNAASVLLLAFASFATAQRQGRQRNGNSRTRAKGKADQCHGKEMDKCYEQIQAYGKADRPSDILKTKEGIDKLCGWVFESSLQQKKKISFQMIEQNW